MQFEVSPYGCEFHTLKVMTDRDSHSEDIYKYLPK